MTVEGGVNGRGRQTVAPVGECDDTDCTATLPPDYCRECVGTNETLFSTSSVSKSSSHPETSVSYKGRVNV